MAHYYAIAAVSQAIRELLLANRPAEFATLPIEIYRTKDFEQPFDTTGVSIYLYRLSMTSGRRNRAPSIDPDGTRHLPPVEADLHFVISPWAEQGLTQQMLLGWIIRTMEDSAELAPPFLNSVGPRPNIFGPAETVEMVQDSISIVDLNNLWNFSPRKEQASAFYTARAVALDSQQRIDDAGPVQTRVFEMGALQTS
jgi:hypothetical protein